MGVSPFRLDNKPLQLLRGRVHPDGFVSEKSQNLPMIGFTYSMQCFWLQRWNVIHANPWGFENKCTEPKIMVGVDTWLGEIYYCSCFYLFCLALLGSCLAMFCTPLSLALYDDRVKHDENCIQHLNGTLLAAVDTGNKIQTHENRNIEVRQKRGRRIAVTFLVGVRKRNGFSFTRHSPFPESPPFTFLRSNSDGWQMGKGAIYDSCHRQDIMIQNTPSMV